MADYSSPFPTQFGYVPSAALSNPLTSDAHESDTALSVALDALMDKIQSGELSIDELLHRIAEQACLQSGATSSALALLSAEDNAVVCRASCGANAPPLGARLNAYSGISGECLRTDRVLCCQDSENDARVETRSSRNRRRRRYPALRRGGASRLVLHPHDPAALDRRGQHGFHRSFGRVGPVALYLDVETRGQRRVRG